MIINGKKAEHGAAAFLKNSAKGILNCEKSKMNFFEGKSEINYGNYL